MTITTVNLRAEAEAEVRRLTNARALLRDGDEHALAQLEGDVTWIATSRRKRSLHGRVCLVWRVGVEDASGRLVESRIVPMLIDVARHGGMMSGSASERRTRIASLLSHADAALRARLDAECETWRAEAAHAAHTFTATRLAREREIAPHTTIPAAADAQPGLFDRRADRSRQARASAAAESSEATTARLRAIADAGAVTVPPARLLLVLVP